MVVQPKDTKIHYWLRDIGHKFNCRSFVQFLKESASDWISRLIEQLGGTYLHRTSRLTASWALR